MGARRAIMTAKPWVIRGWVYRKWWHFMREGLDVTVFNFDAAPLRLCDVEGFE